MIELERTIHIRRARPQVFDYLANLDHIPEYIGPVNRVYRASTAGLRTGTRVTVDVHFLGLNFSQRAECIDHRRPRVFAARSVGGRFYFEAGFELRLARGGTVLEGWGRAQAPQLFAIAEPILGFFIERQIDRDLGRVKAILEQAP